MLVKQEQHLIKVVPYDSSWSMQFEQEAEQIKKALGNNCIDIHYIGSTSVPGLAAKPVIDMIPVVLDLSKVDSVNTAMRTLGYEAKGEYGIPFRRYFQKGDNQRTHHAHVFELGNFEIERHLKFRDWMRSHPEDREAYARLKQELARQYSDDITAYCLGKEDFIVIIDKKAGFNGLRMVKALTPREWDKVRNFRQFYFFDKAGLSDPYTWTFEHDAHVHFVLFQGSEIIGYTHLQLWPNNRAALRIIVIDELKRNHQYGNRFLTLCEKWLKSHGYQSLHIESSPDALRFYRNNGYIDMSFDDPYGYEGDARDTAVGKIL
ncbi:TPA: GNAT family N-acetyltransferase [Legionella pneumophila]|uniref:GNAT family N-acetyltransferase n=1 Tax=Legionella sp. PATHC039 TaxID=2992042 RepID=UPI0007785F28|nr:MULTISPECIES: GNAT family N-acetyltransferase [Legionella]HAT8857279.1 GNAT family N-acetyltransferase [Legionella pneumophila subsp. pneumophila]MCW8394916.1 bifunctional GrpB family protein/GNAT family N-acetyltransferase [Legionella sp. PATHC039]HAT7071723.1 GNAT family N-acetyltransferase [Legionella pneumophila]HAT7074378.1 GNAT family N-acetyltransferase [Legionella pneumophila]HAT8640142.1 GNAT family N-acetyltransferase [Legionella pneumophila]